MGTFTEAYLIETRRTCESIDANAVGRLVGGLAGVRERSRDQTRGAQPWDLISFRTLPQVGYTVHLRVGSCIQWHRYDAGNLHLVVKRGPAEMSVRVLP